ncbi:cupredoxin domain-containing protein [Aliiglaciecola sp. 3_MG-2023]|uniref:cupredoxin domain-containing protein n=1 Tax=Aliiglaciecola sp. 3_MG-2023 TaxID=3062644 RepID=UPI0026E167CF|nr:cupredoxin domain-containing protein [Aliiglaciecola sp. 3_MG-2023]MDO6695183.1 cupredoxin domain-containing protein [Aliiglaciecola sp. 3_MG-2023]
MQKFMMLVLLTLSFNAIAIDEITITIRNHLFYPPEIDIPEHKKVKINFINQDDTPEEIDSFDLNREKVVFANSRSSIFVGPLEAGRYRYFGEYHPNTAIGFVNVVSTEEHQDAK